MSFTIARSPNAWGMIFVRRALLEEQPLEHIRGADHFAMAQRKLQVRNAGVEVVGEALHHRGQFTAVGLHEVIAEQQGQRGEAASQQARARIPISGH